MHQNEFDLHLAVPETFLEISYEYKSIDANIL